MAKITKQSEWLTCEEPDELGSFLKAQGKCNPQRFRWLAVEWLRRVRHWVDEENLPWVDAYIDWVEGRGNHPNQLNLPGMIMPFINHPPMSYFWIWLCMGNFPEGSPIMFAAYAGASACEDFPRFEPPPTMASKPLDYSKQHKSRSAKRKSADPAQLEIDRATCKVAHDAWETAKKKHTRKVGKLFCDQFRCVAGNPFRAVVLRPEWRSPTVMALTRGIEEGSAYDRLPILADALEEAGCDSVDLLRHCREPGSHVRGCWVVDLLLERF